MRAFFAVVILAAALLFVLWIRRRQPPRNATTSLSDLNDSPLSPESKAQYVNRIMTGKVEERMRAELELLERHGSNGLRVLVDSYHAGVQDLYPLGSFPQEPGFPWTSLKTHSIPEAIERIWAPLAASLPRSVAALKRECRLLAAGRRHSEWILFYLLPLTLHDGTPSFQLLAGGAPMSAPRPPVEAADQGWSVPAPLRLFYSVHDGWGCFSIGGWGGDRVLPCGELGTLRRFLNPGEKVPYDGGDLLEFFPDGAGNGQHFKRRSPDDTDPPTVDWDHETRELGPEKGFFAFLDERLIRLKEE